MGPLRGHFFTMQNFVIIQPNPSNRVEQNFDEIHLSEHVIYGRLQGIDPDSLLGWVQL